MPVTREDARDFVRAKIGAFTGGRARPAPDVVDGMVTELFGMNGPYEPGVADGADGGLLLVEVLWPVTQEFDDDDEDEAV